MRRYVKSSECPKGAHEVRKAKLRLLKRKDFDLQLGKPNARLGESRDVKKVVRNFSAGAEPSLGAIPQHSSSLEEIALPEFRKGSGHDLQGGLGSVGSHECKFCWEQSWQIGGEEPAHRPSKR